MRIGPLANGYARPVLPTRTPLVGPGQASSVAAGGEAGAGSTPRERRVDRILQGEVLTRSRQVGPQFDYRNLAQGTRNAYEPLPFGHAPDLSPAQRAVTTYRQTQFDALGLEHRRIDLLA